jgi:hypothetical protein
MVEVATGAIGIGRAGLVVGIVIPNGRKGVTWDHAAQWCAKEIAGTRQKVRGTKCRPRSRRGR